MMTEKESGYTVLDTVDVCDRPVPNADPAGGNSWSYGGSGPQPVIGNGDPEGSDD